MGTHIPFLIKILRNTMQVGYVGILSMLSVPLISFNETTLTIQTIWTTSSEFGTYRLCEQRRFRRACASVQSRQNLRCSLIQAVSQEEPSDRKPDPWPLRMSGHAQLKFVMTECSKTQIRLTGLIWNASNQKVRDCNQASVCSLAVSADFSLLIRCLDLGDCACIT